MAGSVTGKELYGCDAPTRGEERREQGDGNDEMKSDETRRDETR